MRTAALFLFLLACLPAFAQRTPISVSTNTTFLQGDMLVWSGTAWIPVNKGTNGQALTMSGTNVAWVTLPESGTATNSYTAAASSPPIYTPYFQATSDIYYNVSGTNIQAFLYAEPIQDLMSTTLKAGANITISYDDGAGAITVAGISSGGRM
jgi:hypothetical protein